MTRPDVPHYERGGIEPIDYILANNMNFSEGSVVKYITRWKYKGDQLNDLKKIKNFVDFLIEDYEDNPEKYDI